MKRKIYKELLEWKQNRSAKEAILIDGARRVGKSYIVEEFARNEYKSYILIDFGQLTDELREVFDQYLPNLDLFYQRLGLVTGVKLFPRESLIVFDEVQRYPKARQAIKHLVKDGRYDYIETGSLVSINKNVEGIIIPSEERHLSRRRFKNTLIHRISNRLTKPSATYSTCTEGIFSNMQHIAPTKWPASLTGYQANCRNTKRGSVLVR